MNSSASGVFAHQAIEHRTQRLRRGQTHDLVGVVDAQLHRGQLRGRNPGQVGREHRHRRLQLLERHGSVDELDLGRLPAGERPAGQRVLLGLGQPEPVDPHS
jgi:hypothetical protein